MGGGAGIIRGPALPGVAPRTGSSRPEHLVRAPTSSLLRLSVVRFVVFASSPGIRTAALSSKRNAPSHNPMPTQDELKKQVGFKAVDDYVQSGMVIGLGTGR